MDVIAGSAEILDSLDEVLSARYTGSNKKKKRRRKTTAPVDTVTGGTGEDAGTEAVTTSASGWKRARVTNFEDSKSRHALFPRPVGRCGVIEPPNHMFAMIENPLCKAIALTQFWYKLSKKNQKAEKNQSTEDVTNNPAIVVQ